MGDFDTKFLGTLGPTVVREIGVAKCRNFDRMVDEYRIFIRHAPSTGGVFEKTVEIFSVPEDQYVPGIAALCRLLRRVEDIERDVRVLKTAAEVEFPEGF